MSNFNTDYKKWEKKFPHHVIIMKDSGFYSALGISASAIHGILGFKLFKDALGNARVGGPNLEHITTELRKYHISYIVIESNQITIQKTFPDSIFPKPFNNPEEHKEWFNRIKRYPNRESQTPSRKPTITKGAQVSSLIGRHVVHINDSYGEGIIVNAYHVTIDENPENTDIYIEIKFDNGKQANPFSLSTCRKKQLLNIDEVISL